MTTHFIARLYGEFIFWLAINHAKKIEGDLIEFGCYDAKVAEFLIEYNEIEKTDKKFHLFDIFDNPPTKDVGDKHSPNL